MSGASARPSVAVVGGGIIGLSIAWRLARGGARVELFERGALAGEASHVAAGMLAPVSEADPAEPELLALGLESAERWASFAAELETDSDIRPQSLLDRTGTLLIARDADEGRWLEREADLRRAAGLECALLTPREARRLEPDLAPGLRGALHVPVDHAVDPRQVAVALAVAARGNGALLHDHAGPIEATDDPRLAGFDRIVIASGAWPVTGVAPAAATHPVKGQLLILRDPEHAQREEPIARHVLRAQTVYCVPRGDGRYVIGATMEHRGEDRTVTAWAVHDLLRELFEILPAAREFVLDEALAGLRPATTSGDPLIGPVPGDPAGDAARVLYAVGHYRGGVLLAPATADRIAALVLG
ncbi:MAG: glycine oxidase ThiO [Solirubrobacteraceae bacterium]|nr:glycine oxidase ThiO [Solirubrobacteraceae bacterium]